MATVVSYVEKKKSMIIRKKLQANQEQVMSWIHLGCTLRSMAFQEKFLTWNYMCLILLPYPTLFHVQGWVGEGSGAQVWWEAAEGALGWRKSGWREILSISITPWQEGKAKWESGSAHREQGTGSGEMASSCARKGLDWILGKIPSSKGLSSPGTGCPRQWWSPRPRRNLKAVWMWHLGTGVIGGFGSSGGMAGLDHKGIFS